MTLELARQRRSQSDLIRELAAALASASRAFHNMAHGDRTWGDCDFHVCLNERDLIEKAKLLDDYITIDEVLAAAQDGR